MVSDQSENGHSYIYTVLATGGTPKKITPTADSHWHGWSPDGSTLVYCAQRNSKFDIHTIRVTGGEEKRPTSTPGLKEGPDYSADGKYIYFNSDRTGHMQIWRMLTDGTEQTQITFDDLMIGFHTLLRTENGLSLCLMTKAFPVIRMIKRFSSA